MTTTDKRRAGFTLIELLIVFALIAVLFAILIPSVFSVRRKFNENEARLQIQRLEANLEEYALAERAYSTTEQGLFALVYIPDNVGGFQQPGMGQPSGMPGMDQSQQFEQSGGMLGGGASVGPTDFSVNMNQSGMQDMSGTGGFDPISGQQMGNPMTMDGMASGSAWNQPIHNPQLYTQQRLRSVPYAKDAKQLIDPWKFPYRYDNSRDQYGLNPYTGEDRPAIWSAGYDKIDGTDDDIMNWVPSEAAQKRQEYMQRLQMQQQQMGGMMDGGMMGGGSAIGPGSMMNDPTGTGGFGSGMPNMPGQGMPTGPGGMPTGPGGMPTGPGGMPTGPGGMPTGPGGMPTGPGGMPTGPGGMPTGPGGMPTGPGGMPTGM